MSAELEDEVHDHCNRCYNANCKYDPAADVSSVDHADAEFSHSNPYKPAPKMEVIQQTDLCPILSCRCGARYHRCKTKEHKLLCQDAVVPCINEHNGCPTTMPRRRLSFHLQYCPASVIHCTMEWNRWPVYSAERQSHVPFAQDNLHARYGQLDVALALRDQRVLNSALKAPRSMTRALKNQLTPRFPAVPILSCNSTINNTNNSNKHMGEAAAKTSSHASKSTTEDSSLNISDDEDHEAPWEVNKSPPGLARSVYHKLISPQHGKNKDKSCVVDGEKQNDTKSNELSASSNTVKNNDSATMQNLDLSVNDIVLSEDSVPAGKLCITTCQVDMNRTDCKTLMKQNCPEGISTVDLPKARNYNGAEEIPPPPSVNAPGPALKQILGLDLTLQAISRYKAKPPSMYTFRCAQELRRDQYSSHFLNVHMDIHGGLSGWLEHRCPLAHYGCTYSKLRLYPESSDNELIYSEDIEGYGVKSRIPDVLKPDHSHIVLQRSKEGTPEIFTSKDFNSAIKIEGKLKTEDMHKFDMNGLADELQEDRLCNQNGIDDRSAIDLCKAYPNCDINDKKQNCDSSIQEYHLHNGASDGCESCDCDYDLKLLHLPEEVLLHIAKFLDNFSLYHVSLSCTLLRDVCRQLLETKGIVIQHWERTRQDDNKCTWNVSYHKWMFSCAFTEVKKWRFADGGAHMSDHLKNCPFNAPHRPNTKPYHLAGMMVDPHDNSFLIKLQRMYPLQDLSNIKKELEIVQYNNRRRDEIHPNNELQNEQATYMPFNLLAGIRR